MPIMKRDVNFGLLLLIVAALLMFSGFTVYYQTTFKNVSKNFETKIKELESVSQELESKRGQLNETSLQLQLRKQQEEGLSKKFVETESERSRLESDKKKLEVELANTKASLASTAAKLAETQSQLSAQVQLAADLSRQVANLRSDVDKLEKKNNCLKSTAGASETC